MLKLELRPWRRSDAADTARYADNPRVAENLRDLFPNPYTLADAESFIAACLEAGDRDQLCRAIVVDGTAAGGISVTAGTDVYRRDAELGYWLGEPFWGRGIMTEAVRRICREAFSRLDIVRIHAAVYARNGASCRVLEKAGFTREGILRQSVYKNGEVLDACLYALLREELS